MSTTLTNGLKLPDKGSVDWYADMQNNYAILDGAVGTIAEHTTQIAGKAPAVHTHTKSDITDFPAYGNAAGTICEGNDSRLSDARTPVAHTHTKSDVTDLFNSANTWTGNNTYSKPVVIGRNTDTGYFFVLKNSVAELGSTPASAASATIGYSDKNNDNLGYMGMFYDTDGSNRFRLFVRNKYASGAPSTSGNVDYAAFQLKLNADQSKEGILRASFKPHENNIYDLGSSSYQWNNLYAKRVNTQSVNGVNPGALSFPSGNDADSIAVDITDWYIQDPDYPDDPTKKILDATNHKVDTAVPGWLHINFPNVAGNWAYARKYAAGNNMALQCIADGNASSDFANVALIFPIYSSCYVRIKAKTATVRIFPCLSNV